MSSKGGARRKRQRETGRPSIFFIIAITLGVLLLVVAFAVVVSRPMKPQKFGDAALACTGLPALSESGGKPPQSKASV